MGKNALKDTKSRKGNWLVHTIKQPYFSEGYSVKDFY